MKLKVFALSMCAALLLSSCGSWKNTGWGTTIGTVAGTAVGLGIGYWADRNSDSNTGKIVGASVGAAVGATTGALIGRKMDKAAAAAKQVEGAQVELVDVNGLPAVKVTFESGILFGFNSSTLSDEAKASLAEFATVLKSTPDADVAILGHTDNVGTIELETIKRGEDDTILVSDHLGFYYNGAGSTSDSNSNNGDIFTDFDEDDILDTDSVHSIYSSC